jgi:hypothetical protein
MGLFHLFFFLVSSLAGMLFANSTTALPDSICCGVKGDKGSHGHPGIRGLRGFKGIEGPSGPKGDPGNLGLTGPPGPQGPKGSLGEMGRRGSVGRKGQKGSIGPRGVEGSDGEPGVAGHTGPVGPRGSRGEKGSKGMAGLTGPRGRQGVPGSPIDEETLKNYFNPVKTLQAEVTLIKDTLQSLISEENPAAHLHARDSSDTLDAGTRFTLWFTSSGLWYSPILRGGMTYNDGYITVPKDGLYYIYAQLHYNPQSGQTVCSFYIEMKGIDIISAAAQNKSPDGNQWDSRHIGILRILSKGDRLSVVIRFTCRYELWASNCQFGAFLVD